jgi:hypothetical protein
MPDAVNQVKFKRMWLDLQKDLLKRSSNSRQVMAEESSHFMPFDQPGLIVEAIERLVDGERATSPRKITSPVEQMSRRTQVQAERS